MTDFQPIETLPTGVGADSSGLVTYQANGDLEVVPYPESAISTNTADVLIAQQTADQAVVDAAAAQATADSAQADATQALADALAAQTVADSAQADANTAISDAFNAQTTADAALADATRALSGQFYDYSKFTDVLDIGQVWEAVGNLATTLPIDGSYVIGAALTWTYDTTTSAAQWRWRIDGGAWNENFREPKDVNDKYADYYAYPDEYLAGPLLIEVEAQKSGAGGTFDVQFLDLFAQKVGETSP